MLSSLYGAAGDGDDRQGNGPAAAMRRALLFVY